MATCRRRPQLGKSRERGLSWTFESRHWFAGIKTVHVIIIIIDSQTLAVGFRVDRPVVVRVNNRRLVAWEGNSAEMRHVDEHITARCERVLYHRSVTSAHDGYSCCDVLLCVPSVRQNTGPCHCRQAAGRATSRHGVLLVEQHRVWQLG